MPSNKKSVKFWVDGYQHPNSVPCEEGLRLLDLYIASLDDFHRAQETIFLAKNRPDSTFQRAIENKDIAYARLRRIREVYWGHVKAHGCRDPIKP